MAAKQLNVHSTAGRFLFLALGLFALVASVLTASIATAGNAHAQDARPIIGGGTPIIFSGGARCTATAAGYDRWNHPVAFTAGHCSHNIGEPVVLEGGAPVGTVAARNEQLDYTVIALDPARVLPVRQNGVAHRGPAPAPGEIICKLGASTGFACGNTWEVRDSVIHAQVCAGPGDSGAPIMAGDRLVGMLNGGTMPPTANGIGLGSLGAVLPPCYHAAQSPFFLPAYGFVFDTQIDDASRRNWPGADFRMA